MERSALAQARQLDRKVVATVLPQDMRTDVLVERLTTLARRHNGRAPGQLPRAPLPRAKLPRPNLPVRANPPAELGASPEPALPHPVPPAREPLPLVPPPPPPRVPAPSATTSSVPHRVVLLDDDVMRGDLVAQALREGGIAVQLAPTDLARTRWALLRRFGPELFLLDSDEAPHAAWLERLESDSELRGVPLCPLPFAHLFEESTGTVRSEWLLERVTGGAPTVTDHRTDQASTGQPSTSQPSTGQPSTSATPANELPTSEELDDERPTLIYEGSIVTRLPEGSLDPAGSAATGGPDSVDELLGEESAPLEHDGTHPRPRDAAPAGRAHSWVKIAGVVSSLALLGAASWWLLGRNSPPITSVSAAESKPTEESPAQPTPPEPADEPAAPPAPPPSPWEKSKNPDTRPCESVVEDATTLPRGDIAQASHAWKRARSALVLGDVPLAQSWMCRAVLLNEQSLAVEALAESYLETGAPHQAKRWIDVALTHRPDRARTLELLGDIEHQLGHIDEARRAWLQAFRIEQGADETLALLGKKLLPEAEAALRGSRTHRAEVLFRRAATFRPEDPEPVLGLARVADARQKREAALLWIDEALRREPEDPRALALRAELEGPANP